MMIHKFGTENYYLVAIVDKKVFEKTLSCFTLPDSLPKRFIDH